MKQVKFWNILIFSVMTLQIMVACGDDSDSGDRDETTQTIINGKSFILNHGWGKAYFNNDKFKQVPFSFIYTGSLPLSVQN